MELVCRTCLAPFPAPMNDDGVHVVTVFDLTVFQQPQERVAVPICPACTEGMMGSFAGGQ